MRLTLSQRVEHRGGGGAGQGITAVGRAVMAGGEGRCGLAAPQAGPDRHTVTQRFGRGDDIRPEIELLVVKIAAGAAIAGLHLVENQQPAPLAAQRRGLLQVLRIQRMDAAFALHGLKHQRGNIRMALADLAQRRKIVARRANKTADQGLETGLNSPAAAGGQCGQGAAVERAFEHRDPRTLDAALVRVQTGELDRCLVGFGA